MQHTAFVCVCVCVCVCVFQNAEQAPRKGVAGLFIES